MSEPNAETNDDPGQWSEEELQKQVSEVCAWLGLTVGAQNPAYQIVRELSVRHYVAATQNDRLKADLRAISQALTEALATPDRAARQKLLERAAARARDAAEGGKG